MAEQFHVDSKQFNAALKEILASSKRDYAVVVNSRAWHFGRHAIKNTTFADKTRIEIELGKIGTEIAKRKDGKFRQTKRGTLKKGKNIYHANSFAAKIINSRRDDKIFGDELHKAIDKLIAARKRSVHFIRSGWTWGMVELARAWRKPEAKISPPPKWMAKGQPKGKSVPARDGFFSTGSITNSALLTEGTFTKNGNPMPVARSGADRAMSISVAEMKQHLEKKFQALAKKHNALPTTSPMPSRKSYLSASRVNVLLWITAVLVVM